MIPNISARNQPIGTDHHIPVTPISGIAESMYARITLVPNDKKVSMTDIPGFPSALYRPYKRKRHPMPQ